jgi:hypothetical protein
MFKNLDQFPLLTKSTSVVDYETLIKETQMIVSEFLDLSERRLGRIIICSTLCYLRVYAALRH